jgi:hypothetical protein
VTIDSWLERRGLADPSEDVRRRQKDDGRLAVKLCQDFRGKLLPEITKRDR